MTGLTPDAMMATHRPVERLRYFHDDFDDSVVQACESCSYDCDDSWYSFSIPWPCEIYLMAEQFKAVKSRNEELEEVVKEFAKVRDWLPYNHEDVKCDLCGSVLSHFDGCAFLRAAELTKDVN